MANPKLEDGYVQIANESLLALACIGLGKLQMAIVAHVLVATYGPGKEASVFLDHISLGHMLSTRPGPALDAFNTVVAMRLIVEDADMPRHYRFNKDWESWMKPTGPLIDPDEQSGARTWVRSLAARYASNRSKKRAKLSRLDAVETANRRSPDCGQEEGRRSLNRAKRTQDCATPPTHGSFNCAGGPGSLGVVLDASARPDNGLQSPSRAGARTRNLEIQTIEKEQSNSTAPLKGWDEAKEKRRRALIREAHGRVKFDEDGFDLTYTQLHAALQNWLRKGVDEGIIVAGFDKAMSNHVKPAGFVEYVRQFVMDKHTKAVNQAKADAGLPDMPPPKPVKYLDPNEGWD